MIKKFCLTDHFEWSFRKYCSRSHDFVRCFRIIDYLEKNEKKGKKQPTFEFHMVSHDDCGLQIVQYLDLY